MSPGAWRASHDAVLPDRAGYRARWRDLHGGYDPASSPVADRWLSLIERAARPLARRRVSPDAVTAVGVLTAGLAVPAARGSGRWRTAAAAAVVVSAVADSLDGSIVALGADATAWGYVVDSLADRAADGLNLLALRAAGAPAGVVSAAAAGSVALEYARSRAAAAGFVDIGVVTAGERPMRVSAVVSGLLLGARWPRQGTRAATAAAGAVAVLSSWGAGQFLHHAASRLRELQAGPMSPATARAESATSGSPPPG